MVLVTRWLARNRLSLMAGLLSGVVIGAGGWAYSGFMGVSPLETMVTWAEWFVSILLLPWFLNVGRSGLEASLRAGRVRVAMQNTMFGGSANAVQATIQEDIGREEAHRRPGRLDRLTVVAVVVLAMDLLVRAAFHLGYKPFL